jgi:excisionase family DNA binding protein
LASDEILTLPKVEQLLKVAEKTVYTMAQKGELPAFKVGGQWRFRRTDLDAWIDAKTRRAAGEEEAK